MSVPSYSCICDTNIWVNLCNGNKVEEYFVEFNVVAIADAVENEIIKWERNDGIFRNIYDLYIKYKNVNLFVINKNEIDPNIRRIIEIDLMQEGFTDLDNRNKTINNLGEYVSFLYAYHLEIPYIHSDDTNFSDEIESRRLHLKYKGIQIVTWNEIAELITNNHDERLKLNKLVNERNSIMQKRFNKQKEQKMLKDSIAKLAQKFSKKY